MDTKLIDIFQELVNVQKEQNAVLERQVMVLERLERTIERSSSSAGAVPSPVPGNNRIPPMPDVKKMIEEAKMKTQQMISQSMPAGMGMDIPGHSGAGLPLNLGPSS